MLDLAALGKLIRQHRRAQRLTQAELAQRARVGRSTLDALENGRSTELGFGKVARILAALGLTLKLGEGNRGRPTLEDLFDQMDELP